MRPRTAVWIVGVLVGLPLAGYAQGAPDADALRLRTAFFQREFEGGALEGATLFAAAPQHAQLRAWHVLNLARASREDEAVTAARALVAAAPQDGWSWFALGGALLYKGGSPVEAIGAAERALQMMPDNLDAVWLRAQTLAGDPIRREDAIAFVDAQRSRVKNAAEILAAKGYALYSLASAATPRDEERTQAAFAAFEEARRADPANLNALYLHGTYLNNLRRADEAYPLLKKAVALAPGSTSVHQAYWAAVKGSQTLTAGQKTQEITADLSSFLDRHGSRPGVLHAVALIARDLKLVDRQRQVEERIVREFDDTREAEWILTYRIRDMEGPDAAKNPEYRRRLREYTSRPRHYHTGLLGEMYRNLFFVLVRDEVVDDAELLRAAEGMIKYEQTNIHLTHVASSIALADRKILLDKAEELARASFAALTRRVERTRAYTPAKEFEDRMKTAPAMGHDALGWVLFAKGRLDEAEKELLKAYEIEPDNRNNLHHLGKYYEAKNDIARAEEFYAKGIAVQGVGTNPSDASLRALYERRHGSSNGYDTYLEGIRDRDRVTRREKIMAARVAAPAPVAPFTLKSLDAKQVSLDSLKGRIVVINFWGIWCGWCVREMPDLQKLHEKYRNDPDVVILTIDNDPNPDDVAPWMKQRGYTMPVLFDDGYVTKVGVHAFPTTWFLDREGRKVFEKVGWSEKLLEEFSWRVEAIRDGGERGRGPG